MTALGEPQKAVQGDRAGRERRVNNLAVQGASAMSLIIISHGTALTYDLSTQGRGPAAMVAGITTLGCAAWAMISVRMAKRQRPAERGPEARSSCIMALIAQASCSMIGCLQDATLLERWSAITGIAATFALLAMVPWSRGEARLAREQEAEDALLAEQARLLTKAQQEAERERARQKERRASRKIKIRYGEA